MKTLMLSTGEKLTVLVDLTPSYCIRTGLHPDYHNVDRSVFKKTDKEKVKLANAKQKYKKLCQNKEQYDIERDKLLRRFLSSSVPRFGNLSLKLLQVTIVNLRK